MPKIFKRTQSIFRGLLFLLIILALGGCQMQMNSVKSVPSVLNTDPLEYYQVGVAPKNIFDEAFLHPKPYFIPESPIKGALIAANLNQKEELAGFFERLKDQHYQNIILLAPTDLSTSTATIFTSYKSFKTPEGFYTTDQTVVDQLQKNKIAIANEQVAGTEIATHYFLPFAKHVLPDAHFIPFFISEKAETQDLKKLQDWLTQNADNNSLVIAVSQSDISPDPLAAEFQFHWGENIFETFDVNVDHIPFKSQKNIQVLLNYLKNIGAQTAQNQFFNPENGSMIEYFLDGPVKGERNFYLTSMGDIMLGRLVRSLMDKNGLDYPFQKMEETYFRNNDILLGNLEGPIARNAMATSKTIAFRFLPDIVPLLKKYSFDVLSLANNHAYDMGKQGFLDSHKLLFFAGISPFGDPVGINNFSVAKKQIGDRTIAFLGLDDVDFKIDLPATVEKIKTLKAEGNTVIPFIHWGIEYIHTPNERQQTLAHAFLDAGADMIIACHPHVVETFEIYKGKPIFYSLGNAIFDQYFSADTQEGLTIGLEIAKDQLQIYFLPIKIDRSQMRLMTPEERTKFLERFIGWGNFSTAEKKQILKGKIVLDLDSRS